MQASVIDRTRRSAGAGAVIAITFALAAVSPARAEGSWCAQYGGGSGGTNCGFYSFEQCMAAISGMAASAGRTVFTVIRAISARAPAADPTADGLELDYCSRQDPICVSRISILSLLMMLAGVGALLAQPTASPRSRRCKAFIIAALTRAFSTLSIKPSHHIDDRIAYFGKMRAFLSALLMLAASFRAGYVKGVL